MGDRCSKKSGEEITDPLAAKVLEANRLASVPAWLFLDG